MNIFESGVKHHKPKS